MGGASQSPAHAMKASGKDLMMYKTQAIHMNTMNQAQNSRHS